MPARSAGAGAGNTGEQPPSRRSLRSERPLSVLVQTSSWKCGSRRSLLERVAVNFSYSE